MTPRVPPRVHPGFNYQQNEIWYFLGFCKPGIITIRNQIEPEHDLDKEARPLLRRFIAVLRNLDVWEDNDSWALVTEYYKYLMEFEAQMNDLAVPTSQVISRMLILWNGLTALSSNYEEICREWFLPTLMGEDLS